MTHEDPPQNDTGGLNVVVADPNLAPCASGSRPTCPAGPP